MRLRCHDERGVSVFETSIGMVLAALVALVVISAMTVTHRNERYVAEDSQALGSLRTSMQRLTKELRQARKVYADSTASSLRIWVDYNRDNQQDLSEQLTWRIEQVSGGDHLVRRTGAGVLTVVSTDILASSTFEYEPALPDTTVVRVKLRGDATANKYAPARRVETEVRLRNAPTD